MTRLLLVRHGDTDYNHNRRFLGHTDIEMSAFGIKQVMRLRDYIAGEKINAVFSSDLKRTIKTAEILTAGRKLDIVLCPELREVNYGECEGLSFGQIGEQYPDVAAKCLNFNLELDFPGGEDFKTFIKRTRSFLKRLKNQPANNTVLVVSHGGPLKTLICHFLGLNMKNWDRIHLDTASLSIVYLNAKNPVLTRFNDTSYLRDLKP